MILYDCFNVYNHLQKALRLVTNKHYSEGYYVELPEFKQWGNLVLLQQRLIIRTCQNTNYVLLVAL